MPKQSKQKVKSKLVSNKKSSGTMSKKETGKKSSSTKVESVTNLNTTDYLESAIDNSTRLFGIPHQFLEYNDPRIGDKSDLGRCFAEKIVMEEPIVCLKPGVPDFLPGMSKSKKAEFVNLIANATSGSKSLQAIFDEFTEDDDAIPYYALKSKYSDMMTKVNMLCRILAAFIGISNKQVPWVDGNVTFGTYDWRYYSAKNQFGDLSMNKVSGSGGSKGIFLKDVVDTVGRAIANDTEWIRFYVDSGSSFNESASNSTTASVLESYTEKLEGMAKELEIVSGMSGVKMKELAEGVGSSVDEFAQQHIKGDGAIQTFLRRLTGATNSIIQGGNLLIPEIWSQSEYAKSYSFTINLTTPYGCPEAWFLNIGVPMMHILGMCLPQQMTANTYKSPYLVKCFSPGWFVCDLGIIDNMSMDKGANSSWSVGGLPNEVKISLSVKDLYSTLSLPGTAYSKPSALLGNTGMLEFLMVNCGVDLTHQDVDDRYRVWAALLSNNLTDWITRKPYDVQQYFKEKLQKAWLLPSMF